MFVKQLGSSLVAIGFKNSDHIIIMNINTGKSVRAAIVSHR